MVVEEQSAETKAAAVAAEPAVARPVSVSEAPGSVGEKPSPIARFLPSLADVAFLVLILFLYVRGGGAKMLLGDGDTGWHLRTGQWILEHGRVPDHDIFSFTKAGQPWFAWEWLWDTIFGWLQLHWGLAAVALVSTVVLASVSLLVYKLAWWKSQNALVSIAVTVAAIAGSSMHWLARPHISTWLFFITFYWLLERDYARKSRAVYWLPALMVLWTNMHGGFIAGLMLVGAYAAGEAISALVTVEPGARAGAWANVRRYGWLTVACLAASLVNPYGYQLHLHVAKYLADKSIQSGVQEFLPYNFQDVLAPYVEVLVMLAVVAAAWNIYQRRFVYPVLLLMWVHAGLFSARHVPIFVIAATPVIAACLTEFGAPLGNARVPEWLRRLGRDLAGFNAEVGAMERVPRIRVLPVLCVVILGGLFWLRAGDKFQAEFDAQRFPVRAVERMSGPQYASGVFSTDQWGDYLIYRRYPNIKVFIDGRSDFYGEKFGNRYLNVVLANWDWQKPLDEYRVHAVLLPVEQPVTSVLKASPGWRVVYDDHVAILFERVTNGSTPAAQTPQGTQISAAVGGGVFAVARSPTYKPVVHGSQSYARRN